MGDGGDITERPDGVDPTLEFRQDATAGHDEPARTRTDMPRRSADPTRQDLPRRPRGSRYDRTQRDVHSHDDAPPDSHTGRTHDGRTHDGRTHDGRTHDDERSRRSPWRWARRAVYLLLVLIVGTPPAAGFYVWLVAREDVRTHSDAILVLGAAQFNGRPGDVLAWRLQHALNLYREGVSEHIMTVGGNQPGDNYTEAGSGKTWLNRRGVPQDRLVAVPVGNDTLQSMVAAGREFRRLGWHTAVIVTDPPHALRSRTMARANGIKAVTSPTRSGPTVHTRDTEFHYIVRETGGYLYFEFIGRWRDE